VLVAVDHALRKSGESMQIEALHNYSHTPINFDTYSMVMGATMRFL